MRYINMAYLYKEEEKKPGDINIDLHLNPQRD